MKANVDPPIAHAPQNYGWEKSAQQKPFWLDNAEQLPVFGLAEYAIVLSDGILGGQPLIGWVNGCTIMDELLHEVNLTQI